MKTRLRPFRLLLTLGVLCSTWAQALELVVWDPQLQTKLGYGEVVGNRLNLQLVTDYSGPVVALFSRDSDEKNSYSGLLSRYGGSLRGGTLTLETEDGGLLPLGKFLTAYKLSLTPLNTAKTFSLPGLKSAPPTNK